jgi:DNA-binding protein HU-beta
MNKQDIVEKMSQVTGLTKKDSENSLNAAVKAIEEALAKGDKVTLVGFGTFAVSKREARTGRNPQTGAEIKIPAKKVVKFKVGQALKDKVN